MCIACYAVDLGSIRLGVACHNVLCMLFYFISLTAGHLVNLKLDWVLIIEPAIQISMRKRKSGEF